ncbi:MAG: hypothetical protein AAFY56_19815 [Pseudomonadota bacterium]
MRFMYKFSIPVEKGNEAVADGSLSEAIETLLEQAKPEAAYFTMLDGERSGLLFFETEDASRFTALNEPLFAKLDAAIEIIPVQSIDELRRGLGST